MPVVFATTSRVNPGRLADAIALSSQAAKVLERHGAAGSRLVTASVAGEEFQTHTFTVEFPSLEACGALGDEVAQDSEIVALMERSAGTDSPARIVTSSILVDVPLGRPATTERGRILEVYIGRPRAGAFEASLDVARRWFDLVEQHGATSTRLLSVVHGGSLSEAMIAVIEYADNRTWGRVADALQASPEGQTMMAEVQSTSWPVETLSSGLYTEIPL